MILETTLLLDRWLHHDTYGIGAMLGTIGRKNPEGDDYRLPATPAIINDMENADVAVDLNPDASPALVLYVDTDARIQQADQRERQVSDRLIVTVAYCTRDVPPLDAARDGAFVLRAVKKSLTAFNSLDKSREYRKLNDIQIAEITSISTRRVMGAVGLTQFWGFVFATVKVIDSNPA